MADATVCRSVRDAKAIFRMAVDEDLLPFNPFDRLRSTPPPPDRTWQYVSVEMLGQLFKACPTDAWRRLLGLCRLAGLRQGEALRLLWKDVDLRTRQIVVVNPGRYRTTKHRTRRVPAVPLLHDLLTKGTRRESGDRPVVAGLCRTNLWRDFRVILRCAGIRPWKKWCHTLRKNCETDWAERFPIHVVAEWLGNSPEVALRHYVRAESHHFREASGLDGD